MNIYYDMDGADTLREAAGRFPEHLDNVAKLTTRVHLWPGYPYVHWVGIGPIIAGLVARGVEVRWVVRPMEFANEPVTLHGSERWRNAAGESGSVTDWWSMQARDVIKRQVKHAIELGCSQTVIVDTRSHVEDKDVTGFAPRKHLGWPVWRRVAVSIERLLADLPECEWVAPPITQGFDMVSQYNLDGAQHSAPTLNFNYWQVCHRGMLHVRPPVGVGTICGGMRWTSSESMVKRWLSWCRDQVAVDCDTIKYESHELLARADGIAAIRRNIDLMGEAGFANVVLYSTNTFGWNQHWIKEMGR